MDGPKTMQGATTTAHSHLWVNSARGNTADKQHHATGINNHETEAITIGTASTSGRWRSVASHPAGGKPSAVAIIAKSNAAISAAAWLGRLIAMMMATVSTMPRTRRTVMMSVGDGRQFGAVIVK